MPSTARSSEVVKRYAGVHPIEQGAVFVDREEVVLLGVARGRLVGVKVQQAEGMESGVRHVGVSVGCAARRREKTRRRPALRARYRPPEQPVACIQYHMPTGT
jgi:hypothetical protein